MFMQMMEWDPVLDTVLYGEEIILPDNGTGRSYGSLIQARNGKIYGTAPEGGENGLGIIFECDPLTLVTVTKHSFSKPGGSSPCSTLLELEHKSFSSKNIEACGMYTSPGGKIWTESGEYTDTILTSSGCDSILMVNLTVHHPDTNVTQEGRSLPPWLRMPPGNGSTATTGTPPSKEKPAGPSPLRDRALCRDRDPK